MSFVAKLINSVYCLCLATTTAPTTPTRPTTTPCVENSIHIADDCFNRICIDGTWMLIPACNKVCNSVSFVLTFCQFRVNVSAILWIYDNTLWISQLFIENISLIIIFKFLAIIVFNNCHVIMTSNDHNVIMYKHKHKFHVCLYAF